MKSINRKVIRTLWTKKNDNKQSRKNPDFNLNLLERKKKKEKKSKRDRERENNMRKKLTL